MVGSVSRALVEPRRRALVERSSASETPAVRRPGHHASGLPGAMFPVACRRPSASAASAMGTPACPEKPSGGGKRRSVGERGATVASTMTATGAVAADATNEGLLSSYLCFPSQVIDQLFLSVLGLLSWQEKHATTRCANFWKNRPGTRTAFMAFCSLGWQGAGGVAMVREDCGDIRLEAELLIERDRSTRCKRLSGHRDGPSLVACDQHHRCVPVLAAGTA